VENKGLVEGVNLLKLRFTLDSIFTDPISISLVLFLRNLGNNLFPELPAFGLNGIIHLKAFNNPNLREFPGPDSFPHVRTLVLSYAYHCCPFNSVRYSLGPHPNSGLESSLQEDVIYPTDKDFDSALSTLNLSELWPGLGEYCLYPQLQSTAERARA